MNFKKYTKKRKLKSINKRKLKNTNKRKLKNTNKKNTIRKRKYGGVKSKKRKSIKLSPPIIRKSKRIRHQEPDYEEENLNNTIEFMEENVADELPEEKLNNTTEFMEDVAYELPEEKLNNIENENINNISEFMEDVADELPEMKEEYIYQNNETTNYNMETLINSNQFQEYNEYKEYNIGSNAECGIIYNFFGIEKESYYVNDINFYIFHEGGDSYRPYISLFFDKQRKLANQTPFKIANTVFTTVTTNINFQTIIHKDKGDFSEGFGNLIVIENGNYLGGETCFPQYGVGVNVRTGDILFMNVHEYHGNLPIIKKTPDAIRLSIVCYLRHRIWLRTKGKTRKFMISHNAKIKRILKNTTKKK